MSKVQLRATNLGTPKVNAVEIHRLPFTGKSRKTPGHKRHVKWFKAKFKCTACWLILMIGLEGLPLAMHQQQKSTITLAIYTTRG